MDITRDKHGRLLSQRQLEMRIRQHQATADRDAANAKRKLERQQRKTDRGALRREKLRLLKTATLYTERTDVDWVGTPTPPDCPPWSTR